MSDKIFMFSYGMNTDPESMALRTGTPVAIGRALVRNHAFRFALHADVYPCLGVDTHGVLWEITEEQLAALDQREGYPNYYDRTLVQVESGAKTYTAWMYGMTGTPIIYPPSDRYYGMLDRGYTYFGVPKKQIVEALAESVVEYAKSNLYSET